ncbi:MAG: hypothetical protein HY900_06225 [Deltaproteobacteria bacterium]|nr:hypothetical protein [Deltaproteobacteria bacterium]
MTVPERDDAATRLLLYRRASAALGAFFGRFCSRFCAECLEVTGRHHAGDPRADVELLEGVFPGCCQAGVADALWVPRSGDDGRFSPELARRMERARAQRVTPPPEPPPYRVRERGTGLVAEGYGCVYGGEAGCRLGELKSPLCIAYACDPIRGAVAEVLGRAWVGEDGDDFCGCLAALRACVSARVEEAEDEVGLLEERLAEGARTLAGWEEQAGVSLFEAQKSSKLRSSPSCPTR